MFKYELKGVIIHGTIVVTVGHLDYKLYPWLTSLASKSCKSWLTSLVSSAGQSTAPVSQRSRV